MPVRGFGDAIKRMRERATRAMRSREALEAVGRMWRNRHMWYFRRHVGELTAPGGGPPGDPWKGLKPLTADLKSMRPGHNRKMIETGVLRKSYSYKVDRQRVTIFNTDFEKTDDLQNRLGFVVVVLDPAVQDPQKYQQTQKIIQNYWIHGKKPNGTNA